MLYGYPSNSNSSYIVSTSEPGLPGSLVITAGSGVTFTPGPGSLTISSTGGGGGVTSIAASDSSLTFSGSTGVVTVSVASNGVSNAALRQSSAVSVVGNASNATANVADITSGGGLEFLASNSGNTAISFRAITLSDLPSSIVTSVAGLTPLFGSSQTTGAVTFSLSNAAAGSIWGNFAGSLGAPSYNAPGTADQILGVAHTGGGLEYKTLTAGSNIILTPAAGSITIAGNPGTVTTFTAGSAAPFFTTTVNTPGSTPGLVFNITSQNANTSCMGPASGGPATPTFRSLVTNDIPWALPGAIGSTTPSSGAFTTLSLTGSVGPNLWLGNNTGGSAAPGFASITTSDLPSTVVTSSGGLTSFFTTSIVAQSLSFSLANGGAGSLWGNFSGSSGAPSYNAPGSADTVLGVAHTGGGLEYKSITGTGNISVTPTAGNLQIATTATVTKTATAVVNFGSINQTEYNATVTVAASWVGSGTILVCSPSATATADHDPDDYVAEGIMPAITNIVPGVSFDVSASAPNGTWGRYNINVLGV